VAGSVVHPIKDWWLGRRIRGGIRDGTPRGAVLAKLGVPDRVRAEPEGEVLVYDLGQADGYALDYSILVRDDVVVASWRGYRGINKGGRSNEAMQRTRLRRAADLER
jgi:hypothetical protein